jgi:hypothetical protein
MPGVSKDGSLHGRHPRPSFETHRIRDAPQDEVLGEDAYMIRTSETVCQVCN